MQNGRAMILLIDDEERLLFGLSSILDRAGYQTLTATNGTDGLRLARDHHPDLIICDVMMPPPDGFELRNILSQDPALHAIPFIFVTARTGLEDRLRGIRSGADDYITKPFDRRELLARVNAILRRDRLSRQKGIVDAESQIERVRREIMKNFTHELRTPLSQVLMSLNLVLKDKFGDNEDERQEFLETALTRAQHLKTLVDDLLFLIQADQGMLEVFRQRIQLDHHFRQPIRQLLSRWEFKTLTLAIEVAPDVQIHAPRHWFQQAVLHLVDNACKFSPDAGHIDVHLGANGEGGCLLTVTDQGEGIPNELREKVFERYYQISQGDGRIFEGLGVGLTIARTFARAMGGDVRILEPDAGCSVQMILAPGPLSGPPPESSDPPERT